jgi:hypothetical protein
MLAVISARKRLPWRTYREAFDTLHMRAMASHSGLDEPLGPLRSRSLRLLSELAHAELPPYGSRTAVAAAPTVLARVPRPGLPRGVLCGSRDIATASLLRNACSTVGATAKTIIATHPYSGGYAPSAVLVETDDETALQHVAEQADIHFAPHPPAWSMLSATASISSHDKLTDWTSEPDPTWPRQDFDTSRLAFGTAQDSNEIHFSVFQDPVTHRQVHRLWRGTSATLIDRYWGRWFLLRDRAVSALLFDDDAQLLAVPATVPLPPLHARAIALFSGLAPSRQSHPSNPSLLIDAYAGIPREAAESLASKLDQQLTCRQLGEGGRHA